MTRKQSLETEEGLISSLSPILGGDMAKCIAGVRSIAGYDIDKRGAAIFQKFHSFISEPTPAYIINWRSDARSEERWYITHVEGVLGNVRGALAAAHYHADNLKSLENRVSTFLLTQNFAATIDQSTVGLGGTRMLDFEYHAFILACRRSLDYLAVALSAYFKQESNSFRTFTKSLPKNSKHSVSEALRKAFSRHERKLGYVLAVGKISVRNRIAHYDFVSGGCINLTATGFCLVGGGENLDFNPSNKTLNLSQALDVRLSALHECIEDMIQSFIEAARTEST